VHVPPCPMESAPLLSTAVRNALYIRSANLI